MKTYTGAPINPEAAVVLSAYTGIAMAPFGDIHEYAERMLGRGLMTHEFASEALWEELRAATKDDFLAVVGDPR